jgi:hypothetical protein
MESTNRQTKNFKIFSALALSVACVAGGWIAGRSNGPGRYVIAQFRIGDAEDWGGGTTAEHIASVLDTRTGVLHTRSWILMTIRPCEKYPLGVSTRRDNYCRMDIVSGHDSNDVTRVLRPVSSPVPVATGSDPGVTRSGAE